MKLTAIRKIVQNSISFSYFYYCFIHSPRPYTHVVPKFHFEYFFQPFYQHGRIKNTNIIKYVSSLEIFYFC